MDRSNAVLSYKLTTSENEPPSILRTEIVDDKLFLATVINGNILIFTQSLGLG
jgi:hypothetical protein